MQNDVTARLASLGYAVTEADAFALGFLIRKTENRILTDCNVSEIPEGLRNVAVDMVCGEFLFEKKQSGRLGEDFDAETAIKSIKEGDTQITYAVGDAANPVDRLINHLMNHGKPQLAGYRRFAW
jgi:hypothetical protein